MTKTVSDKTLRFALIIMLILVSFAGGIFITWLVYPKDECRESAIRNFEDTRDKPIEVFNKAVLKAVDDHFNCVRRVYGNEFQRETAKK
jgi:hypothetical protein